MLWGKRQQECAECGMRKEEGNALILYPDAWPVGGRIGTESGLPVDVVVIDGGLELASGPVG